MVGFARTARIAVIRIALSVNAVKRGWKGEINSKNDWPRGVNDDGVAYLAALTFKKPFQVWFIELMPFKHTHFGDYDRFYMPIGEIIRNPVDII
jgi:molybdenum cofactor biosynthesis enzyme MoaA